MRALLTCAVLLLLACTRERPVDTAFVVSTGALSRTGLLAVPNGVVLGNEGGRLLFVESTGTIRWSLQLGREIAARPALSGTLVGAVTVDGTWVGVGVETGDIRWRMAGQSPVTHALTANAQQIFAVTNDAQLMAVDSATGIRLWARPLPANRSSTAAPWAVGEMVLVSTPDGLAAFGASDGTPVWKVRVSLSGMSADADRAYVTTQTGELWSIATSDGAIQWKQALGKTTGAPFRIRDLLWAGTDDGVLHAFHPQDGKPASHIPIAARISGSVLDANGYLWVPTLGQEGKLLVVSPPNQKPIFEARLNSPLRFEPLAVDGNVWVLSSDGRVTAFRVQKPLASSQKP